MLICLNSLRRHAALWLCGNGTLLPHHAALSSVRSQNRHIRAVFPGPLCALTVCLLRLYCESKTHEFNNYWQPSPSLLERSQIALTINCVEFPNWPMHPNTLQALLRRAKKQAVKK